MSNQSTGPFIFSSRRALFAFICSLFALSIIATVFVARNAHASQGNTQSQDGVWQFVEETSIVAKGERQIVPQAYRTVQANEASLKSLLGKAPLEFTKEAKESNVVITLPMPDGSFARFRIEESPIMEPALAAQYPQIKNYRGKGIDDSSADARLQYTTDGLRVMIISDAGV